jgi:ABC-type glycerol-3-phosphate transport system substrate-binding protein
MVPVSTEDVSPRYVSITAIEKAAEAFEQLNPDVHIEGVRVGELVDMLNELIEHREEWGIP